MSHGRLDPPLLPKNGHVLRILVPVRVSDPDKQNERSLGDQKNKVDKWLKERVTMEQRQTMAAILRRIAANERLTQADRDDAAARADELDPLAGPTIISSTIRGSVEPDECIMPPSLPFGKTTGHANPGDE